jgi:hypothetical protein
MTTASITLITYLWHYLVARTLFDQLLRPLERGDHARLLALVCVCGVGFLIGRITARRR